MDETSDLYRDAVRQARDLLRWRSPLRAELWASRLTAEWHDDDEARRSFMELATRDDTPEARLITTALASVAQPPAADDVTDGDATANEISAAKTTGDEAIAGELSTAETTSDETTASEISAAEATGDRVPGSSTPAGEVLQDPALRWMELMGQAQPKSAWYGTADPYGEQALAVISFVYPNGKEPHLAVVGIDQANGGFAVDAVIEEPKFLDDLDVRPADPVRVAGRIINAFELTDAVLGAPVADTLPQGRAIVLARARSTEASTPDTKSTDTTRPARAKDEGVGVRRAERDERGPRGGAGGRRSPDDTVERFDDLPDVPGADEAFATLVEFVGDRPSWWSPARVTQFVTSWLPREAIMSETAIDAMPQVLRAWTAHLGDHPEVRERVETDSRDLRLLMADELRFSLAKRLRLAEKDHRGTDR
ncbi:hypothetical protein ACFXJ8_28370 [Nonomuraea sp. NPDC059194]|uniref:hypothetical protein n=1 Tax=Nonomuraea sp. NPDC059194 TaxID=3346764 RepID=UPI0036C42F6F